MQAIITRYIPATNFRGSRIKASCARGKIMVSYDSAASDEEAHKLAVAALVRKFCEEDLKQYGTPIAKNPWNKPTVCGQLPSGEHAHVFVG